MVYILASLWASVSASSPDNTLSDHLYYRKTDIPVPAYLHRRHGMGYIQLHTIGLGASRSGVDKVLDHWADDIGCASLDTRHEYNLGKEENMSKKRQTVVDFPKYTILEIPVYDTKASDETNGEGLLTFMFACSDVTEGEKKLGSVCGGLGSVVISVDATDDEPGHYYQIRHEDLWYAIQRMRTQ